jgi:hypothetical protein
MSDNNTNQNQSNHHYVSINDLADYLEDRGYCNICGEGLLQSTSVIYTVRKMGEGDNKAYMVNRAGHQVDRVENAWDTILTLSTGKFHIFDNCMSAIQYAVVLLGGIDKVDYWGDW